VFSGDSRTAILQLVLKSGVAAYLLKSEPVARVAEVIRLAAAGHKPIVSDELCAEDRPRLTKAEQHLLMLLARGMKYQHIAEARVTSPETVRKQVDALLLKLLLDSREELIAWAADNGYGNLEIETA
jgi:two-component system response regulator DesR